MRSEITLADACSQIVDCEHKTAPINLSGEHFVVGTPAMRGNRINLSESRRVSRETFEAWTRRLRPQHGDLLFAREAPVGPLVRIPPEENVAPGQRTVLLRPDPSVIDSDYLYYLLSSPLEQALIGAKASGSTVAHLNVADVRSFPLPPLPALAQQQGIAEVLGALDDKIAANATALATVESLMVARYELAVGRDPSHPRLEAVAQFHNRRRVPLSAQQREVRVGRVPYYGATGVFGYVDEALFDEHLVLVGEDGSVVRPSGQPVVQYVWGPAWVNNHAHVLTGVGMSTETLRLAIQRANVVPIVTGAVQPKISMGNLKALTLDVPGPPELVILEPLVSSLSAVVRAKTEESRHLAEMRDALLPLLMSGKIRVKDAERVVEGVV